MTQPTLLFYPQASTHRFEVDDRDGADFVCAWIDFGGATAHPLLRGLPEQLRVPTRKIAGVDATLSLLFDEAFAQRAGREAAIDRLVEYFVVLLLRHAIDARLIAGGTLAGLADPRLSKAMTAMHEKPAHSWSLAELASTAGMSRARFAAAFRDTVGTTPLEYLTDWRIGLAQTLLKRGKPLQAVAPAVGYDSPVALSRAFARRVGVSASRWVAQQRDSAC